MEVQQRFREWMEFSALDAELRAELEACQGDAKQVEDRFYRDLEFGTGGLRGAIGAGTNRMNLYTVAKATRGFGAYLLAAFPKPSCAIAYDSRNKSDAFARIAAATLADMGVQVHIYAELMPTPMLSFAVRNLGCSGGIVITASHNPAKDNGYKVYGADGCQITLEGAEAVLRCIGRERDLIEVLPSFEAQVAEGGIRYIPAQVMDAYHACVLASGVSSDFAPLHVVYSPLNGAGNKPVRRVLAELPGVRVTVVPEQERPDGNFPTCPYPNPEKAETMALAVALAREVNADFCLATDPDCDRVGVGVPMEGAVRLINGNEMGAMLFDFVCQRRIANGTMPARPVAVKTIVTTELATAIAARYGVELRNVLTGFKFIGEQIGKLEAEGGAERYLFGFEESYGYLSGSYVRDKDAVSASMLICQMAAYYKARQQSLLDVLDSLYERYGYYKSELLTFEFAGASGMAEMTHRMDSLREGSLGEFGGQAVESFTDYWSEGTGLPRSNVIALALHGQGHVVVRPSGTEPKLKLYVTAQGRTGAEAGESLAALCAACRAWMGEGE